MTSVRTIIMFVAAALVAWAGFAAVPASAATASQGGTDIFFQNEMPYDPPSQSAWMAAPNQDGYPAFLVTPNVKTFQGYGLGSYSLSAAGAGVHDHPDGVHVIAGLVPVLVRSR
jgi:hypothetical protein